MDLARNLIDEGFKVKLTKPREGEEEGFVLTYFIPIKVNYQVKYPPKIYLVAGDAEPRLLNEDTIDVLDKIRVKNVDVTLNKRFTDMGNTFRLTNVRAQRVRCGEPQPLQTRAQRSGSRLRDCQKYFFDKLNRQNL